MRLNLINKNNTAVLVIDIQNAYCSSKGKISKLGFDVSHFEKMVSKIDSFVKKLRDSGFTIVFTRMIEDPKYMAENAKIKIRENKSPVISSPNTFGFSYFKISPKREDVEIIKKSYDAFSNQKLSKILKYKHIKNLIIIGAYTPVCVDTTVRSAFTKGYNVFIPQDLVSTVKESMYQQKAVFDVWRSIFAHVTDSKSLLAYVKKR